MHDYLCEEDQSKEEVGESIIKGKRNHLEIKDQLYSVISTLIKKVRFIQWSQKKYLVFEECQF